MLIIINVTISQSTISNHCTNRHAVCTL